MHKLTGLDWKKACLTIGVPMIAMIGKDLQSGTAIRSMIGGALIVLAACLINYCSDPRK